MFRVTLDGIIMVYVVIILCSVFFSWLAAEVFRRGKESRRRKHFVVCAICDQLYEDRSSEELSDCPKCGARNERERVSDI